MYICQECTKDITRGETLYFCLKCKNAGDKHEHKLSKFKGILEEEEDEEAKGDSKKKEFLENLLDEYYNMDFEDLIGGGSIKTRFKYRKVGKEDFGLTEDEILLLDDKQLNKLVSLKKYRPYLDSQTNPEDERPNKHRQHREMEAPVNLHRIKSLKNKLQDELREKRKMLKLSLQQELENDKEKYFKGQTSNAAANKLEDLKSKNKKRKEKMKQKRIADEEGEENAEDAEVAQAEEDASAAKKRKRLALYGVK